MSQTFSLEQRNMGAVTILYLDGPLRMGYRDASTGQQLSDAVKQLLSEGTHLVALDLRGLVRTPDSSGLGELVAAEAVLRKSGGGLVLVNVPPKLRYLIEMMRLDPLFRIVDTEADAVTMLCRD